MTKLYVVYMVIPADENPTQMPPPVFDFTGCIDEEHDGASYCWSFLKQEEAVEARKLAWDYCKHNQLLAFVDMGVKLSNGEEDVEASSDLQEDLENQISELVSDIALEKTTGCIDVALTALLKAAILDLEAPPEIFFQTADKLYGAIMDEPVPENTPPPKKVLH